MIRAERFATSNQSKDDIFNTGIPIPLIAKPKKGGALMICII
jgi:hypothetical protein